MLNPARKLFYNWSKENIAQVQIPNSSPATVHSLVFFLHLLDATTIIFWVPKHFTRFRQNTTGSLAGTDLSSSCSCNQNRNRWLWRSLSRGRYDPASFIACFLSAHLLDVKRLAAADHSSWSPHSTNCQASWCWYKLKWSLCNPDNCVIITASCFLGNMASPISV